ncbi:MAG: 16S rRNA (cytosine(967)-C(5))-methyltransferase RsmB [Firmicutes bacterium]|nr:16S rRNA (cytosine(967)-C(5))-methyltransferase RsmB [Bacillota bacterium]
MAGKKKLDARTAAFLALTKIEEEGAFTNLALSDVFAKHHIQGRDKGLATEITYGVVTYKLTLDWLIEQITGRPAEKLDRPVLLVLRIGFYQLFYLDRIPAPAIVHTTVELVKKTKKRALAPFVNGVMRGALRKKNRLPWPSRQNDLLTYLSLVYSHPSWMVKRWLARMTEAETEALLQANNTAPAVSLRVNNLRTQREQLLESLARAGLEVKPSQIIPEGVLLTKGGGQLTQLPAYQKGLFHLQSESAMLVSRILDPAPGSKVLDACSAPGGKTTHLAALMKNQGEIIALDIFAHRLQLVELNAKRLGAKIIKTKLLDAQLLEPEHFGLFDHILLDVPCSGLGVIRRKPDIKWRRREEEIKELAKTQKNLLDKAAAVLKRGGTLVYSTCTNEPEETSEVIKDFLARHPDFTPVELANYLPASWHKESNTPGIQLYPHLHGIDGFYIVKLRHT